MKNKLLKFIDESKTIDNNAGGVKCFPQQTFGVSQDSPENFRRKHTLRADNNYTYQHQYAKGFDYVSQNNFFSINGNGKQEESNKIHERKLTNPRCFHHKKGMLSEFMDRNGWMSKVISIMGHQRTSHARNLSNKERQRRIAQKNTIVYNNPMQLTPQKTKIIYHTREDIMSQKVRLRQQRNKTVQRKKNCSTQQFLKANDSVNAQQVIQRTNKTASEWRRGGSKFSHKTVQMISDKVHRSNDHSSIKNKLKLLRQSKPSVQKLYETAHSSRWASRTPNSARQTISRTIDIENMCKEFNSTIM